MSNDIDNFSVVHYFAAEGWKKELKDVRPEDHIETWVESVKLSSPYGAAESSTWRVLWGNPVFTPEKLALLHDKFPKPTRYKGG